MSRVTSAALTEPPQLPQGDPASADWAMGLATLLARSDDAESATALMRAALEAGLVENPWSPFLLGRTYSVSRGFNASNARTALQKLLVSWTRAAFTVDEERGIQHAVMLLGAVPKILDFNEITSIHGMGDAERCAPPPPGVYLSHAPGGYRNQRLVSVSMLGALAVSRVLPAEPWKTFAAKPVFSTIPKAGELFERGARRPIDLLEAGRLVGVDVTTAVGHLISPVAESASRELGTHADELLARSGGAPLSGPDLKSFIELIAAGANPPDGDWARWVRWPAEYVIPGESSIGQGSVGLRYFVAWQVDGGRTPFRDPIQVVIEAGGMHPDCGAQMGEDSPLHMAVRRCDATAAGRLVRLGADVNHRTRASQPLGATPESMRAAGMTLDDSGTPLETPEETARRGVRGPQREALIAAIRAGSAAHGLRAALDGAPRARTP